MSTTTYNKIKTTFNYEIGNSDLKKLFEDLQKKSVAQDPNSSVIYKGTSIENWLEKISKIENIVKKMHEVIPEDINKSKTDIVDCILEFLANRNIMKNTTDYSGI